MMTLKDYLISMREEHEIVLWAIENLSCVKCPIREKCGDITVERSCRSVLLKHINDEVKE